MGEEELGAFAWLMCHFPPMVLEAGGRVIQGYHKEARRLWWAKVLFHFMRTFKTQWNEHQLKHCWADLVAREQDLLDHLGVVIGGPVGGPAPNTIGEVARFEDPDVSTAHMNAQEIHEFQRQALQYSHILDVESGYRMMGRRYRQERATGAWRAFIQAGPALDTTVATTTTTARVDTGISATPAGNSI
ncbi:hypothetical protein NDU88_004858 [Pleurodeles waltl]|uniref:Uncharacterized protein n=1 Tax=Pleurodeles waltl TaxID=8319 RepID=A0AAV7UKA1_PLEWA|nr:hypothetical protein NDU88_004858 [Pleurodeles waltl]